MRNTVHACLAVVLIAVMVPAIGTAEGDEGTRLPRFAPLEPAKAVESFQIARGFRIELVAAEPLVTDPIAMAFDEDGRLFVIEMRDYSEHPDDHLGQVRMLEDTDGDGRMDRSTLFAEKLSWPTAVICSQGGIFVGAAPDIRYLKDTDGDGKADVNKVVLTGLGRGNVQGLVNTFLYGLDHRIHAAASSAAGTLRRPDDAQAKPLELRGRDFAFDPISLAFEPITGGAQHGATFDDFGRRFVCSNSDHLQMAMYDDRYAGTTPHLAAPPSRMSIAADGPQAEVYRISPVEPWRVLRTKLRVSGAVPGLIEGGGRASGYFTSATGLTIYRGDAMPDQRGHAFVADVGSNIIHRKKLTQRGTGFVGTRIDEKAEFVASKDTWFRPVQMINAPDGCLWVADMYREVIEHPASLPPVIKKQLDLDSGRDRGRIYRIAPEGFKQRAAPKLSKAATAELVSLLEHDNAWHRETASRLIRERRDADAAVQAAIRGMLAQSKSPTGRLHALYALEGLGRLLKADVAGILANDASPEVREHALRLSERWLADDPKLCETVSGIARGGDAARVRFQALMLLGRCDADGRNDAVAHVLERDGEDRYMRWAALNAVGGKLLPLIEALVKVDELKASETRDLIEQLTGGLDKADIEPAMRLLNFGRGSAYNAVIKGLAWSIIRAGDDPGKVIQRHAPHAAKQLQAMIDHAAWCMPDAESRLALRLSSVTWLRLAPPARSGPLLVRVLSANEPPELATAAAAAMAQHPGAEMIPHLMEGLKPAGPAVRPQLIDALLSRSDRMAALMAGLEGGLVPGSFLSVAQRGRLLNAPDEKLRTRAVKLFAPAADRQAVVDRYVKETAALKADPGRGKQLFAAQCAACHKLESVGHEVGPNLAAFAQRGNEAILINLLDPNREVNPQYLNYIIELKDGDIVTGLITSESASSVTITGGNGASRAVARGDISSLRATGKSLMPEGIEATLAPQDAADLLSYLASLKEQKP